MRILGTRCLFNIYSFANPKNENFTLAVLYMLDAYFVLSLSLFYLLIWSIHKNTSKPEISFMPNSLTYVEWNWHRKYWKHWKLWKNGVHVCLSSVTDSHHHQPSGAAEREVFATATDRKRRLRRATIVAFVLYTTPTTLLLDLRNALKRLQRLLPFEDDCVITRKLQLPQIQKAI